MSNPHPNMKGLVSFKPGAEWRGNRKGQPKKLPGLDKLLAECLGQTDGNGVPAARYILDKLRAQAILKGDTRAAEILLERAYGKVMQKIDLLDQRQQVADMFPKEIIDECQNTEPEPIENRATDKPKFSPPSQEPS